MASSSSDREDMLAAGCFGDGLGAALLAERVATVTQRPCRALPDRILAAARLHPLGTCAALKPSLWRCAQLHPYRMKAGILFEGCTACKA